MKRKRKPKPYVDVVIDLPPNVMRDLRREANSMRELGARASIGYLIKARLASALATSTFHEVMKTVQVRPKP